MADRYLHFTGTAPGRFLTRRLGLPQPAPLRRWTLETPRLDGPLLHLTAGTSALTEELAKALAAIGPTVDARTTGPGGPTGVDPSVGTARPTGADRPTGTVRPAGIVLDATGIASAVGLAEVHAALHPVVRSLAPGGRIVVLGTPPSSEDHHQAAAQQALEGFVRSLAKEVGRGSTVQLLRLPAAGVASFDTSAADGPHTAAASRTAVARAGSTLRFLLSPRSAYVSGQVVELTAAAPGPAGDPDAPLTGRTALVTGAARGIGAAIASVLARDGAQVIALDVPRAGEELVRTADRLGATALPLDITAPDAAARIADAAPDGLDILVHNAGITRDRRLANMPADRWAQVIEVNLNSVLRTTDALLAAGALNRGGRIVATASIAGIAGNNGQTNYAAGKAGIIGLVRSLGPRAAAEHGITVNAVAPGFIETRMTAAVPLAIREAGRRMNSLAQGGLPVDVAEAVAWFARPDSGAVNGQVLRVCGQSLLGA
ncbi:3-oxoacyl-ACP reductase [Streptomyces pratensis]|uniref:3-oxoacyl-ACP reductase n=1 Tax=Streptomyces pratensis TaxID=1169025 RepID=UPI00301B0261